MPKVIRVELTRHQRVELNRLVLQYESARSTRERLDMIHLADLGWSIPRIAAHLNVTDQTVRKWVKAFLTGGFPGLHDRPRSGRPATRMLRKSTGGRLTGAA